MTLAACHIDNITTACHHALRVPHHRPPLAPLSRLCPCLSLTATVQCALQPRPRRHYCRANSRTHRPHDRRPGDPGIVGFVGTDPLVSTAGQTSSQLVVGRHLTLHSRRHAHKTRPHPLSDPALKTPHSLTQATIEMTDAPPKTRPQDISEDTPSKPRPPLETRPLLASTPAGFAESRLECVRYRVSVIPVASIAVGLRVSEARAAVFAAGQGSRRGHGGRPEVRGRPFDVTATPLPESIVGSVRRKWACSGPGCRVPVAVVSAVDWIVRSISWIVRGVLTVVCCV